MCAASRGSTQIEATPASSNPPPIQSLRCGRSHSAWFNVHDLTVILRQEQRAGNRAAPDPAGLSRRRQSPGRTGTTRSVPSASVFGNAGAGISCQVSPPIARALQLHAEMPERLRRVQCRRRADRPAAWRSDHRGTVCRRSTNRRATRRNSNSPFLVPTSSRSLMPQRPSSIYPPGTSLEHEHLVRIATGIAQPHRGRDAIAVH